MTAHNLNTSKTQGTVTANRGTGETTIRYWKVGGCVQVKLDGYNVGSISGRVDVATLPAGFRPATESVSNADYFFVEPWGAVRMNSSSKDKTVWDNVTFPAWQ